MTVQELIGLLEDLDPEAEVLMAHQPSYPLQFTVRGVYNPQDGEIACDAHDNYDCQECPPKEPENVVYIVEGEHPAMPYGPREAWDAAVRY